MTGEHLVEARLAGDGRDHHRVGGQVDGGQGAATRDRRVLKLQRKPRGVAAGGAQAHGEDAPAVAPDVAERAGHQDQVFRLGLEEPGGDITGLLRLGARGTGQGRVERQRVSGAAVVQLEAAEIGGAHGAR